MKKIYVWKCPNKHEYETIDNPIPPDCPECGRAMSKVGEYEE
jgi:hypothetical protein